MEIRTGRYITRNNELTPEEVEIVYRFQKRNYMLSDAKAHLAYEFDIDLSCGGDDKDGWKRENKAQLDAFFTKLGFSFSEAIDPNSESYMLDSLVDAYERVQDCNVAANDTWSHIVHLAVASEI